MSGSREVLLGVDVGGTKIEAVTLQMPASPGGVPDVLARVRVPTASERGYEHVLEALASAALEAVKQAGLRELPPMGVGMPGSVTRRRPDGTMGDELLVKNSNATVLNGRPFRAELTRRLGVPVAFANDANCFALAEVVFGAARGAQVAFGVILGTGVGGGLVFGGRAWDGLQGIAGEWGHVSLEPVTGPPCYCGRRGCVERLLSGPSLEAAYERMSGEHRRLPEIAARRDVDPHAAELLANAAGIFGRALSIIVNVLDPDVIVLGGGASNLDVFYDRGRDELARWVFNDTLETRLVRHELGDSAGVYGAALLAAR